MDNKPLTEEQVRQIFKEEFESNFSSGNPSVPPHRHNAIDNLQINPQDLLGWPVFTVTDATVMPTDAAPNGTQRFQFDGTNLREWFRANQTWYQITSSGGGGGSPGGNDTDVQFNDGGNFGGQDTFTFNKTTNVLTLDDGSATGYGGSTITGATSGLQINTTDKSGNNDFSGNINLKGGSTSGDYAYSGSVYIRTGSSTGSNSFSGLMAFNTGDAGAYGTPGDVRVRAGNCGNIFTAGTLGGGNITMNAGNTGTGHAGKIDIRSGSATSSGYGGDILFTLGGVVGGSRGAFQIKQADTFGTIHPNVSISSLSPTFGGGQGVIYIHNATTDPGSNPSNGGILYVTSGALTFRGSGGTITTIAPA